MSFNNLITNLVEIFDGYTGFDFNGQTLFFRHFSIRDQKDIGIFYDKFFNTAVSRGIEKEEDIFKRLKEESDWTDSDDLEIAQLQDYVENLKKTKNKLLLPSQKDAHQNLIDEESTKLNKLLAKKQELTGISAEQYANKMANEEFIRLMIYSDSSLSKIQFSNEEFGSLDIDELNYLNKKYISISERFADEKIQKVVLQDFFSMYLSCCENPHVFFGKFIYQLSAYQMKLLLYGKIFYNIFQYNDDIPESIRKDPKSIFDFVESKKTREKFQSQNKDSDGTIVFGATKTDLDILDPTARKVSLSEALEKSGGSLNIEQMMDLMG